MHNFLNGGVWTPKTPSGYATGRSSLSVASNSAYLSLGKVEWEGEVESFTHGEISRLFKLILQRHELLVRKGGPCTSWFPAGFTSIIILHLIQLTCIPINHTWPLYFTNDGIFSLLVFLEFKKNLRHYVMKHPKYGNPTYTVTVKIRLILALTSKWLNQSDYYSKVKKLPLPGYYEVSQRPRNAI